MPFFYMSIFKFYKDNEGVALSFLVLELLGDEIEDNPEVELGIAIKNSYQTATKQVLSQAQVAAIAARLQEKANTLDKSTSEPDKEKKGMGTNEMLWLSKLDPEKLCLFVGDFEWEKAYDLYCNQDHEVVTKLAELKQEERWTKIITQFETSMYGFGGSYKNDSSLGSSPDSEEHAIPVDATSEEGLSANSLKAIRNMGF